MQWMYHFVPPYLIGFDQKANMCGYTQKQIYPIPKNVT